MNLLSTIHPSQDAIWMQCSRQETFIKLLWFNFMTAQGHPSQKSWHIAVMSHILQRMRLLIQFMI